MRQHVDIQPGTQRRSALGVALVIFDQADFVPGIWLTLAPLWRMTPAQALTVFVVSVVVHLGIIVVGRVIGARTTWL